jgi:site-specific recombinase XerD
MAEPTDLATTRALLVNDPLAQYVRASKAQNTRRAYAADWRDFTSWCSLANRMALPASTETLCLYLADLAGRLRLSTIVRRMSAISQAHQMAGALSPTQDIAVRTVLAGIRRVKGSAQTGKQPILTEDLRRMIAKLPDSVAGERDRALLLVGFAGAFRRSELVGLNVEDLSFTGDGLVVELRRSKTDQEGQGRRVGIPFGRRGLTCPVEGMRAWTTHIPGAAGPLFRSINRHGQIGERLSDRAVALIVQRSAERAGINPALVAGHSLRSGLATAAAAAGVSERAIMAQTGHRSVATVRRYIREGSLFLENPAGKVGL